MGLGWTLTLIPYPGAIFVRMILFFSLRIHCNLPKEELNALKELINLQRNRVITIQSCDKGGGIIILDTSEYIRSCNEHLQKKYVHPDGSESPYYEEVENSSEQIIQAKADIMEVLKEGLAAEIISDDEFNAMDPTDKTLARYYQLFKVHKSHTPGSGVYIFTRKNHTSYVVIN